MSLEMGPEADFKTALATPIDAYEEGLAFFRGEGMLNRTLRSVIEDLERHDIDYAVIGALALLLHGYARFTVDIDLLLTPEGFKTFRERLVGVGYIAKFPGATKKFVTAEGNVPLDFVTSGTYPGDGRPKPVSFPIPAGNVVIINGVKTLTLPKLVELKLASGMSASDRLKDLADVQELMKVKRLGADFADALDPWVRDEYLKLHRGIEEARQQRWDPEQSR
jgi:hypothetical protein